MRKKLGQHLLFDPSILRRMIHVADLKQDDTVVEIGPGKGRLTKMLSEVVKEVVALEIDNYFCEKLKEDFSGIHNIRIVCCDVLKYPFERLSRFKVVANIPYYITTPIIFKLLSHRDKLITATLTIQKEVAERIIAKPGGKDYGVLSLILQYRTEPAIAFTVPKGAFSPPPKVDSAVIHFKILAKPRVSVSDEELFFKVIKIAFSQRRKTLANSLKVLYNDIKGILIKIEIDPQRRPETLGMGEFRRIAEALFDISH